jgi:hypothetical protein
MLLQAAREPAYSLRDARIYPLVAIPSIANLQILYIRLVD